MVYSYISSRCIKVHPPVLYYKLTPTDEGYYGDVLDCYPSKHNDQFLEHEHCLCTHPQDGSQSEVLDNE